jgi:hypothetical protein
VIGADWNMRPDTVEATTLLDSLQAAIVADTSPIGTCDTTGGTSCLDYFLVSADLAEAASEVCIVINAPIATHRPVRLRLRTDASTLMRTAVVAVQRIPPEPVFGPHPRPQPWEEPRRLAMIALRASRNDRRPHTIKVAMAAAYRAWARTAEIELAGVAGVELRPRRWRRGNDLKTEQVPLLGSTMPAACPTGMARRWIARRGRDIRRAISDGNEEVVRTFLSEPAVTPPQWFGSTPVCDELTKDFLGIISAARRAATAGVRTETEDEDGDDEARREDLEAFDDLVDRAAEAAELAENADTTEGRHSWTDWVDRALQGGAGAAHRYCKGGSDWNPTSATVEGRYTVAPGNLLLAEQSRCAALWTSQDEHEALADGFVPPEQRSALPRLTVEQLREAGKSTPVKKAVTYDGFHPRHATMLSANGLRVMAILWEAIETSAIPPPRSTSSWPR